MLVILRAYSLAFLSQPNASWSYLGSCKTLSKLRSTIFSSPTDDISSWKLNAGLHILTNSTHVNTAYTNSKRSTQAKVEALYLPMISNCGPRILRVKESIAYTQMYFRMVQIQYFDTSAKYTPISDSLLPTQPHGVYYHLETKEKPSYSLCMHYSRGLENIVIHSYFCIVVLNQSG